MKILKHIAISTGVLVIVFIIAGIIISATYKDTTIKYLKKYLDKHLITEIEVEKINFSLIKNFPNASVELKNILAKSTLNFSAADFVRKDTDTLLTAENVFFEFSLLKILSGKYILKNIHIHDGKLIALIDNAGKSNYNISRLMKITLDNILNFSTLPLRITSIFGICASFLSLILGLFYFIKFIMGKILVPGWITLVLLMTFFFGIVLFSVGMIGEYLIRVINEVNHSPLYVEKERI